MAKRHPPETRERVMGALYASARWDLGPEPVPNVLAVAIEQGVPEQTASRWWKERDRARDGELRGVATRALAAIAEQGARQWFDGTLAELRTRIAELARDRGAWETAGARDRAAAAAHTSKAMAEVGRLLGVVGGSATGQPDAGRAGADPDDAAARVRRALGVADGGHDGDGPGAAGAVPDRP